MNERSFDPFHEWVLCVLPDGTIDRSSEPQHCGSSFFTFIAPAQQSDVQSCFNAALNGERPPECPCSINLPGRHNIPATLHCVPLSNQQGQIIAVSCRFTQQQSAEAAVVVKLKKELTEAKRLSREDELTGLLNKRSFKLDADITVARSERYQHPLSLIMFDVDYFKAINDRYGHAAGDALLNQLAIDINAHIRHCDLFARLGGDEFAILLPETPQEDAVRLAKRLLDGIAKLKLAFNNQEITCRASFGVACRHSKEDLPDLLQRTDLALYRAKHSGRNCVHEAE